MRCSAQHVHTPLTMSERQGIEIDYCSSCRGVWLDRGELDKIIERAVPFPAPRKLVLGSRTLRVQDRRWEDRSPPWLSPRGNVARSFLEELFD